MAFQIDAPSVWEELKNTHQPIVMYGTGNGADKVVDILNSLGIPLAGITASSGFVRKRSFRGFPVMPIEYFEELYENFTVIITFGSSVPEVMRGIYAIAQKHRTLVPVVPVIGTEIFDKIFFAKHKTEIEYAYNLMADDYSKKTYKGYIEFLYGGKLETLKSITTPEDEVFETVLKLGTNEVYVDIGAYRGDTVDKFLKHSVNPYGKIICAEPDSKTFKKLTEHCKHLENFNAYNVAVTGIDGETGFCDLHGRQSSVGGDNFIKSMTLPTLCADTVPTYIKIDSEGCENEILSASGELLKKYKPKLNIAAYHKCSDIFTLPILISRANPDYKIHLRHHPYIPAWDTLLYCV